MITDQEARRIACELLPKIMARIEVTPDGCWEWMGSDNGKGYGRLRLPGDRWVYVHRCLYELHHGPIPDGQELDHTCRNTRCVHPGHTEPVTHRENIARSTNKGARAQRENTCYRGHPFTPENTTYSRGQRRCRICTNESARRYRARKKQARA